MKHGCKQGAISNMNMSASLCLHGRRHNVVHTGDHCKVKISQNC